jgi:twinkle protein
MEWRTPLWLLRMAKQIGGTGNPTESYLRRIIQSLRETLWVFDVSGASKAGRIIEVFQYARRRYRIELFLLDNLTKCGFADDDYAGQKQFVETLADFARTNDCHVMIVAHMSKGESEDHPAGKMRVKGSGGITDMATTVVEVWRSKAREKAIQRAAEESKQHGVQVPVADKYNPDHPDGVMGADTLLCVLKQNATGKEPTVRLWFDPASGQFLGKHTHRPRAMLPLAVAVSNGGVAA